MPFPEAADLFYKLWRKTFKTSSEDELLRLRSFYDLQNSIYFECTKGENIQFSTLLARMTYVCQIREVQPSKRVMTFWLRRRVWDVVFSNKPIKEGDGIRAAATVAHLVYAVFGIAIPADIVAQIGEVEVSAPQYEPTSYKENARVVVVGIIPEKHLLKGYDEENPGEPILVAFSEPGRNEAFDSTINRLKEGQTCPFNLLEVEIDKDGIYHPVVFVRDPDYLVDVTAISECFQHNYSQPLLYLMTKFRLVDSTPAMTAGNIANMVLDELVHNPSITYEQVQQKIFSLSPLTFATYNNDEVKTLMLQVKEHYVNIRSAILNDFPKFSIGLGDITLEPSFISEKYGIQGRLDLFCKPGGESRAAIVELKSGKIFKPNKFGMNNSHYTQTLLYYLLINSVYGKKTDPSTYILYSREGVNALKYAPPLPAQQAEAIQIRNQIVYVESELCQLDKSEGDILTLLRPDLIPDKSGFTVADLANFQSTYLSASNLSRQYFKTFVAFTAREQWLSKAGAEGQDTSRGLAALWHKSLIEKQEDFEILAFLELKDADVKAGDPVIIFDRTEKTQQMANFRVGDIAVLYPVKSEGEGILNNQLYKCSIIDINKAQIKVKLRYRQVDDSNFNEFKIWHLEPDSMDTVYQAQYRGLFAFLKSSKEFQSLLLTETAPKQPLLLEESTGHNILDAALAAQDYYLLVGPPGTGKTKQMLAGYVAHVLKHTDQNLLLLSYTNRAVDEICDAIEPMASGEYIRLGSGANCDPQFEYSLLARKMDGCSNRKELKELLNGHRIYIATVAALPSHQDIFKLKQFHTAIIDEASQILEPMLAGLLHRVRKFILIGDHKQLPAVVQQSDEQSKVDKPELLEIGLDNCRNSLFERLYSQAKKNGWTWAYGMLEKQGRMHEDICAFPSQHFYGQKLTVLDNVEWQKDPLNLSNPDDGDPLKRMLTNRRCLFIDSQVSNTYRGKTNLNEAKKVVEVVRALIEIYTHNGLVLDLDSIGVITPYRAQIALIRNELEKANADYASILVDTVERYQGGAKDVIIISFCVNHYRQLASLVSLSTDGKVDRKLNVALTRARKHLVLVGNKEILTENELYARLIEAYT